MNPSPTPLPQTPARVAMRHRREMFSAASVCALMLLVLGAASLEQSALSPIFKQWMRRGALLGLGVTVAWGAIRALSFGRRMARARSAMDALPEEAYADLLRQSQEDMRAKARAVNESYGPDVRALYESSKGWYIALMGPFYMMLLLGVLYLVGTLLPQADALARLNHIVWHHSPPLPRLGVIGLLCALPGLALAVIFAGQRTSGYFARRRGEQQNRVN